MSARGRAESWRARGQTAQALVWLVVARLVVRGLPFRFWRASLGQVAPLASGGAESISAASAARHWAAHVERAAARLPFTTKCLPRAVALCWLLRARQIAYTCKIAARPAHARQGGDGLHAWVEVGGKAVLGDLPGPWLVMISFVGGANTAAFRG